MLNKSLQEKRDELWQKTEQWKEDGGFKHRKPCPQWKRGLRCEHYAKARYRHFKTEIDDLLQGIGLA